MYSFKLNIVLSVAYYAVAVLNSHREREKTTGLKLPSSKDNEKSIFNSAESLGLKVYNI